MDRTAISLQIRSMLNNFTNASRARRTPPPAISGLWRRAQRFARSIGVSQIAAGIVILATGLTVSAQTPAASPSYVGSETCKTCHEEIFNNLQKTPHFAIETGARPAWKAKSCESCHGPGAKHAESASADDIKNPAKEDAGEVDRTCLTCHLNQRTKNGRLASGHAKDEVACTTCHSVHGAGGAKLVTRKKTEINAMCASCHATEWAAFSRPYKHRLPEGAMTCVDCHNPHASFRADVMRAAFGNEPGCLQCHSDKRGPFVFEHPVVKQEGCEGCHEPHGSANPRMLIRHQVRDVCLECHSNLPIPGAKLGGVPPAFHDLRSARFQNCTTCHSKIHGSYVDRTFLR
jgi:DmsE family decaheme c-type cytochrome